MKNSKILKTIKEIFKDANLRWTTAGGDSILLESMENEHLMNTICYLSRTIKERKSHNFPMAIINAECTTKWLKYMKLEMLRRNIMLEEKELKEKKVLALINKLMK